MRAVCEEGSAAAAAAVLATLPPAFFFTNKFSFVLLFALVLGHDSRCGAVRLSSARYRIGERLLALCAESPGEEIGRSTFVRMVRQNRGRSDSRLKKTCFRPHSTLRDRIKIVDLSICEDILYADVHQRIKRQFVTSNQESTTPISTV